MGVNTFVELKPASGSDSACLASSNVVGQWSNRFNRLHIIRSPSMYGANATVPPEETVRESSQSDVLGQ